jgi:hypothetical protein
MVAKFGCHFGMERREVRDSIAPRALQAHIFITDDGTASVAERAGG